MEPNFFEAEIDEQRLLEAFSHQAYWDSSSLIYTSPLLHTISNEKLMALFIRDMLGGEQHKEYQFLTRGNAHILLRQLAMFNIDWKGNKTQPYNSSEAKLAAALLLDFTGPKAEYFTNAESIGNPHDNPGWVSSQDSESTYKSICFFAINESYLVFINQYW